MIHIGLTGGIGSGKSTVAKVFETIGVPVFYADKVAKTAYNDPHIKQKVVALLGDAIFKENELQKTLIANIVFNDAEKLKALNEIIHPWVANEYKKWCSILKHMPYVVREAAILIESNAHKTCDKIILVTAPQDMRIARVQRRDGSDIQMIQQRINTQWTDEERAPYCDFIWANDNKFNLLEQILLFDNWIRA